MTKTILALATAGVLSAAMLSTGANAMVPNNTTKTTTQSTTGRQTVSQTKLNRERTMLRRDVRLGRTTAAARLRREINANERSISQAKSGGTQNPSARSMQQSTPTPQPPASQPSAPDTQGTTNK
jgi:hypothetical protein